MQVTIVTVLMLCTMLTHSRTHNPPQPAQRYLVLFVRTLEPSKDYWNIFKDPFKTPARTLGTSSRTM